MPDDIDAILGDQAAPAGDDIDSILGGEHAAIPGVTPRLPPMQPRSFTASDAEIGDPALASGPLYTFPTGRADLIAQHNRARPFDRPADSLEADPIAQGVATSAVLGPIGKMISTALRPTLGVATIPLVAAGEGAAASKSMGGSALTGAALGAGFGTLGALTRGATPAVALARGEARLAKDVNQGVTKAGKALADDVKYVAGEGNAELAEVAKELPEVGKALKTQAKTNPRAAHDVTDRAITDLTDSNDAVFAAIQKQHKGVPLQPIVDRLKGLEERLHLQGRDVSEDAVRRVRTRWEKRYGGTPEARLSAQQARNIRNDLGTIIDPARNIEANTKRDALRKIYGVLNKEIEDVAADTRGVDVAALKARNRQISTLLPVRDALAERVEKEADREIGVVGLVKEAPKKAARRVAREVDYRLSSIPVGGKIAGPDLPASVPTTAAQARERAGGLGYAARVSAGMAAGLTLQQAVAAADEAE